MGPDGTVYVGLALPQAVVAIDPDTGATKKRVVLDSPDIASTKELVTMRISGNRMFIANGSDESATILSLPDLAVLREITIEGEPIRDMLADPKGRYVYLLGRRVHVFDTSGEHELRTIPVEDPTAIATNGARLAVFDREGVTLFDAQTFTHSSRVVLHDAITTASFSGDTLVAASPRELLEIAGGKVIRDPICLPAGSGAQITALANAKMLLLAERRCDSSAFAATNRTVLPASLFGVDAYALAYDAKANVLYTTERAGYLTIYKVPSAAVVH